MKLPLNYLYRQLRPLLFAGDAEKVHERMLTSIEFISKIPGFLPLLRSLFLEDNPLLRTQLFDKTLNNPIGL
ncbi:MAG: quinone-dependent dihydroorotate dehydrogenase, partial [SAR324 cluster bacterium]|nr:quinone-dependent dihydroorotate dehydrogenase [SAR324 cluster bacterium]